MSESDKPDPGDLFRLAFDLSPSGMLAVDSAGKILLANREVEQLFGFATGELIGRSIDELVPMGHRGGHGAQYAAFFRNPQARRMGVGRDLSGVRRDGTLVPIEIGLNPVQTPQGTVVVASVVDITQRRDAEAALRDSEERVRQAQKLESLGTLAGGIAHDFNNILLAIVGYTELVARRVTPGGQEQGDLDQVLRAAERGRQLVKRIVAFSRTREINRVPTHLERIVRETVDLLRASMPSSVEIFMELDPATPQVLADDTLVHQITMNLATNAVQAMGNNGRLRIELAPFTGDEAWFAKHAGMRPGPCARLSLIDTGTGMTPEVRKRIFEPFFTTKPPGQGSGLGLPVTLGIVQSLEGAIDVSSEPGLGTRVDVWLPAHNGGPALQAAAAKEGTGVAPLRVMLVEDEDVLGRLERRQLQSLGHHVTLHRDSVEALADFHRRPTEFDLIITDNAMPGLTGLMLAREITRLRPELPVLMVSGYAEGADVEEMHEHGVDLVLAKPHSARELAAAIANVMDLA